MAQPHGDFAAAVEAADGADGLVKGLLGQILRKGRVMGLGQQEMVYGPGVLPVNGVHILHNAASFQVVSPIYPFYRPNVTRGRKKFDGKSRQIFFADRKIHPSRRKSAARLSVYGGRQMPFSVTMAVMRL